MKKLISLISTKGKSQATVAKEVWKAWKKYQEVCQKQKLLLEKPKLVHTKTVSK